MQKAISAIALVLLCTTTGKAQTEEPFYIQDSMYIEEIEQSHPTKVLHAEPLYIDLIRDLGARKGEHEWNLGMGIADQTKYDNYQALVEYEFAPIDRVGLEVEVPFTFYTPVNGTTKEETPSHRVESLKLAGQWSFLVSPKYNASMAIGYIHEFVFTDMNTMKSDAIFKGNLFNPFLVAAKRFGQNCHSLIYTGPRLEKDYNSSNWHNNYEINISIHYMITGTRNFVGMEFNKQLQGKDFDMTIRPQLRVAISEQLLIGIVAGIPVQREQERFSSFFRVIWEPGHKHKK